VEEYTPLDPPGKRRIVRQIKYTSSPALLASMAGWGVAIFEETIDANAY
jgi:uncharacterized protein (DUF486 family)